MRYVDGYVLPVPTKNLQAYRRIAQKAGRIWREHGALEYRECAGRPEIDIVDLEAARSTILGEMKIFYGWIIGGEPRRDLPSGSGPWPSRSCSARPARCRPRWQVLAWPTKRIQGDGTCATCC